MRKRKKLFKFIAILLFLFALVFFYLNIRYPMGYKDIVIKKSNKYNLDPYLVASIINVESNYNPDAISIKEAKGLMQISPQTGKWASEELGIENYNEKLLFEPEINIEIGTWYLNRLFKEFNQELDLVLMAYNAGSGNVNKWLNNPEYCKDGINIDNIPFTETKNYVERVNKNYKVYKMFYGKNLINMDDTLYINLISNMRKTIKSIIN